GWAGPGRTPAGVELDRLGLREGGDRLPAQLAAEAAGAEASEGQLGVALEPGVHPDRARPDRTRRTHRLVHVAGPDSRRQPVREGVGEADGVVEVAEGEDGEDRAEDLLTGDGHVGGDSGEDGRLVEASSRR